MLSFFNIFILVFSVANGLRTCTVIAPEFLHASRKFSISLAVHDLNVSSQFEVTIESAAFKDYQVVSLQPNGVQVVEFNLPDLSKDEYVLRVEGESGIYAKQSTLIKFASFKPVFGVQIDKSFYELGETLYFRILCLNVDLRPIKPKTAVDVRVMTTAHRLVYHLKDIQFQNYISKGEIFLNAANFLGSESARLAVFMDGDLQTEMSFGIIAEEFIHDPYVGTTDYKNVIERSNHQSSMVVSKVLTPMQRNDTEKDFFNVELDPKQQGKRLQQTELAAFKITSSKPFKHFIWTILGRGNVLSSQRIDIANETREYLLNLKPTNEMSPHSRLIIYYIDRDDEFHYDEATFNVKRELENKLIVSTPAIPAQNEKVEFRIQTAPNSYVGLLAVEYTNKDNKSYEENSNDLNIKELLRNFGGSNNLQRGELTGTRILTTAKNFQHKIQRQKKTWLEAPPAEALEKSYQWRKTWFFAEIRNTTKSDFILKHNLPNENARWRITAFALNAQTGLGFTELEPPLETKQSYNVSFILPDSLYAHEVLVLKMRIENFLLQSIKINVEFAPEIHDVELMRISFDTLLSRAINIAPKETIVLEYPLRVKTAGAKNLKLHFFSKAGNDLQMARLNVKPKGLRHIDEFYLLVDLKNSSVAYERLVWPTKPFVDIISMQHSSGDIYANLFQPILEYLENNDSSIKYQTAEQIISTIAIAKLSLDYLQSTGEEIASLETRITHKLHQAYMSLLNYRVHDNGGFNYFVYNKSGEESIWLTAYILRWLPSLGQYFDMDETILEMTYDFLTGSQNGDGSFSEKGLVINSKCGNDSLALTAHVLWAFLERKTLEDSHKKLAEKSLKFILENLTKSDNLYAKALSLRVLSKAGLQGVRLELQKLESLAIVHAGYKFWAEGEDTELNNVATTALILLTKHDVEDTGDVMPSLSWLIEKGNIFAFKHLNPTHATVLSLEALYSYFALERHANVGMEITIGHHGLFKMDYHEVFFRPNDTKHQHIKFKTQDSSLQVQARGQGLALAVIRYDYSVHLKTENLENFVISVEQPTSGLSISINIKICLTYEGIKSDADLTVLDISLVSGYTPELEQIEMLIEKVEFIKTASLTKDNSALKVLLLGLKRSEQKCFSIELHRIHDIVKQIQVPVTCYEHTNPNNLIVTSYTIDTSICDLCTGDIECTKKCF